ncbi:MAG: hypothetical protein ACRBBP_10880 [Bdellovibrionales bacterium]
MSSSNTNKPWLDQEGNFLEDKDLKKISKNWDQETWDAYLYASGTEKPMSYYEGTYARFKSLLENNEHKLKPELTRDLDLSEHLNALKKDSRILTHLVYWEESSLSEVSQAIDKSFYKTKKLKASTLDQLRVSIEKDLSIMGGLL